jgi:hypothetical protein
VAFLACGDRAIVSVQNPARLDRFSEPQPDVQRTPAGDGYATIETHGAEDTVTLTLAPEITVALRRVFA